jgi:hypothetical protein
MQQRGEPILPDPECAAGVGGLLGMNVADKHIEQAYHRAGGRGPLSGIRRVSQTFHMALSGCTLCGITSKALGANEGDR